MRSQGQQRTTFISIWLRRFDCRLVAEIVPKKEYIEEGWPEPEIASAIGYSIETYRRYPAIMGGLLAPCRREKSQKKHFCPQFTLVAPNLLNTPQSALLLAANLLFLIKRRSTNQYVITSWIKGACFIGMLLATLRGI